MRCLILAAGRFDDQLKSQIDHQREPRLDVFELARALDADVFDYTTVERSNIPGLKHAARGNGRSAAVALLGFLERRRYDAFFTTGEDIGLVLSALTTGEDIGLVLSALLAPSSTRSSHTMIAHTLHPQAKRLFFKSRRVADRIDRVLVYSTSEERLAIDELRVPANKVERIYYHADEKFFRPDGRLVEGNLICAAGQLLRDYDCLIDAVQGLPVKVQIAAGSPWIDRPLGPRTDLPSNVTWGKLNRYELRELYARAALAVVPILQNPYQTGIATILEMMAMGKCVIATRTQGQTDTIVDGQTGIYVPPGDRRALRAAIERMLGSPDEARRIGQAARRFVEENAGLDRFVARVADAVRAAHAARNLH